MKRFAIVLLLAACATRPAADPEIRRFEAMVARDPHDTAHMYVLATYYDRAKDVANAVRWLTRLDELGWRLGLRPDSFRSSNGDAAFEQIAAKLEKREQAVHRTRTAFTFPRERRIVSEGVAYDPVDDVFYFSGGKATLLRVDRNGNSTDLPIDPPGETFARLGMDVDAERRQIWVINAVFDPAAPPSEKGMSGLSVYDLRDGRLLRRVMHGPGGYLNDLTLLKDGTAFVTDTGLNQVLRLRPSAEAFEVWADGFYDPNGIAVSADERALYVADFRGINAVDLATQSRHVLETDTLLHGIDGLTEHRGALIGIQNVLGRPRVVRVYPAEKNRVEVLESKNPILNVPATGVVAGEEYFFLANRRQKDADTVVLKIGL
jgi:sugar lactone lactonase YvrE